MTTFTFEPEQEALLDEWADALESGEFKQGRYRLHNTDDLTPNVGYCCLGILCVVLDRKGLLPDGVVWNGNAILVDTPPETMPPSWVYDAMPPEEVLRLAFGDWTYVAGHLARANDQWQKNFSAIAASVRERTFFTEEQEEL